MNDTVLALLSALAIYGLANFAVPRGSGVDDNDSVQWEDSAEIPPADERPGNGE